MAFVNDYVAEVVLGVVFGQKGRIAIFGVNTEGLVGGDDDPSVLFGFVGGRGGGIARQIPVGKRPMPGFGVRLGRRGRGHV